MELWEWVTLILFALAFSLARVIWKIEEERVRQINKTKNLRGE